MTYILKQQNNKVDCGENLTTSKTQTDKNENLIQISVFRDSTSAWTQMHQHETK